MLKNEILKYTIIGIVVGLIISIISIYFIIPSGNAPSGFSTRVMTIIAGGNSIVCILLSFIYLKWYNLGKKGKINIIGLMIVFMSIYTFAAPYLFDLDKVDVELTVDEYISNPPDKHVIDLKNKDVFMLTSKISTLKDGSQGRTPLR